MPRKKSNSFHKRKARLYRAYKRYKSTHDLDWAYESVKNDMSKEKMIELLKKYYDC